MKIRKIALTIMLVALCIVGTLASCTKKPTEEEIAAAKADIEKLNYDEMVQKEESPSEITLSLSLRDYVGKGSELSWKSSDESCITNSGRVIRPRWTESDKTVTLTATVTHGRAQVSKDFEFTVLKDDEWEDPMFMSDEEFFGKWNGNSWKTAGKINYDFPGLEKVGEAVKKGDIALARAELMDYFAKRTPRIDLSKGGVDELHVNALVDDFYHLQGGDYFQGDFNIGNEWGLCETSIRTKNINPGATGSYSIRAWYNESSYAEICRHNDKDKDKRPRIEVKIGKKTYTIYATDTITVRAGEYKEENFNSDEYLTAQTYGDFLGDDTMHTVLKFDFSSLPEGKRPDSAKLIVYAKVSPSFTGGKRMIVIREPGNMWSSEDATWKSFTGYVYSYNGIPTKNDWLKKPEGADVEYWYQMCRFGGYTGICSKYLKSGDDTYMYKMLSIINDYLKDTGNFKLSSTTRQDPNGMRGGFCRSLDAVIKNDVFINMVEVIAGSELTTPELFTAFLKNIWDTANFLTYIHSSGGNWRQSEFNGILDASLKMPEYSDATSYRNWREISTTELESLLFMNNLEDGSYIEATGGYSQGSFSRYFEHKLKMINNGADVSKEYDELLHKCAYYNILMYTPDGRNLQYGDQGYGQRGENPYLRVAKLYGDAELEYIATMGKSGTMPKWTSRQFKMSTVTYMRSGWDKDAMYMFTNVRGGGQHGHRDFNGVIAAAYGRTLLTDAGIFTYTSSDPYRIWGTSTVAHNTVVVDDKSSDFNGGAGRNPTGSIYDWETNDKYDFLRQSIPYNSNIKHERSILFIKEGLWIVSDRMISSDTKNHNYKQCWHMLPTSKLEIDESNKTIFSNFDKGANIIVSNADGKAAAVKKTMGYYDQNYQQLQNSPYGYFEKSGVGTVTFDTVLIPSNDDKTAKATSEKIDSSFGTTAVKIEYMLHSGKITGYYFLNYDGKGGKFGDFQTDAKVAYVEFDGKGEVSYLMQFGGTYVKDAEGTELKVK